MLEYLFHFEKKFYINLLDPLQEARLARNPNELIEWVDGMSSQSQLIK